MTVTESKVPAGRGHKKLEATAILQGGNAQVHRQVMVLGDPEFLDLRASVVKFGNHNALVVSVDPHPEDFFIGFGEKDISGVSNNIDIWDGPTDVQPEPDTGGHALFVKSDAATDTLAGVGIQSVEIHYLDTAGVEQSVSADLAGVAEVDTGVTDCMFVQETHATAVGSTTVAVGNVDTLAGTGGAVTSRILPAGNKSMSTMKQVPAGKKLILTGWFGSGVATTVKIANIRLRASSHHAVSLPGVYHFLSNARVKDFSSPFIPITYEIPAFAVVKISAWTDGTIELSAQWNGYLEDV